MILYYALGGGLGHIVRAAKIAQYYGFGQAMHVITVCPTAGKLFNPCNIMSPPDECRKSPKLIQEYLELLLKSGTYQSLWIDTFPFGLLGELNLATLSQITPCHYVARYMKWPEYADKIKSTGKFSYAHIIDELHPEQHQFIYKRTKHCEYLQLKNLQPQRATPLQSFPGAWLVMHSGNREELDELIAYGRDLAERENSQPSFIVASQFSPSTPVTTQIDCIPHGIDLASVERIVTACGYNSMLELKPYRYKHHFLPFPRRYDDQFLRAAKAREEKQTINPNVA